MRVILIVTFLAIMGCGKPDTLDAVSGIENKSVSSCYYDGWGAYSYHGFNTKFFSDFYDCNYFPELNCSYMTDGRHAEIRCLMRSVTFQNGIPPGCVHTGTAVHSFPTTTENADSFSCPSIEGLTCTYYKAVSGNNEDLNCIQ